MTPTAKAPSTGIIGRLGQEIAKFGAVGIIGVVVQFASLSVLIDMMPHAVVRANIIATLLAILVNYIGYRYWVYRDTDSKTRAHEITLFLIFSGIGLVVQNGVLYALTYGLDLHTKLEVMACSFIGIGVATLFRFWAYRTWVFSAPAGAVEEAEQILATNTETPESGPAASPASAPAKAPTEPRVPSRRA